MKKAAGISGENTDVVLDVEKQEGQADAKDVEKIAERREEKVKSGAVAATEEEMRAMTLEALEQYEEQLRKPNIVGPKFREARMIAKRIIREKQAELENES